MGKKTKAKRDEHGRFVKEDADLSKLKKALLLGVVLPVHKELKTKKKTETEPKLWLKHV